jgi:acetyl esterase/lipase
MSARDYDPVYMERMRKALGGMFLRTARKIDPDFVLTAQTLNGVDAYWVNREAPSAPGPVIIYLHGGGHVLGSAQQNVATPLRVTRESGIPVLSVEYRLAPEHPFPADVDDAVSVYKALLKLGYQAGQIGVFGDSAGGGLAVSMVLAARSEGLPLPGAVAVLSPSVDHTRLGDTRQTLVNFDPVLRSASDSSLYVGDTPTDDPLLSPVFADFREFPPLLIQVGSREVLLSDAVLLARKARRDGADVVLDVWDGMWHVWQDTPDLPEAELACTELGAFFRQRLVAVLQ